MIAGIISIGDEVLIGQVVNTNASFIASELSGAGVRIGEIRVVGDTMDAILGAFDDHLRRFDIVLVTGGLGPTHDDITRDAACRFFQTGLTRNPDVLRHIEELARQRNMRLTAAATDQALVPACARLLPNTLGTAPGLLFGRDGRHLIIMPGVPYEMRSIMTESVLPFIAGRMEGPVVVHRTLNTTGIAESLLSELLGNTQHFLGAATLAFLPSPYGVRLRISAVADDREGGAGIIASVERYIRSKAEKYIYGTDHETLGAAIGGILTARHMTIALAESCTGGLIGDRLTDVPGSSAYYDRSVIAYSNRAKTDMLGVDAELIAEHGAVSREVAEAMAIGIRRVSGTDVGLSTTGIAGPSGATPDKPVGLVWIGYADAGGALSMKCNFGGDRRRIKERASQAALDLLRRKLLGFPDVP
jgi:nicotinamide-nucleotide amidase